MTQSVKTTIIMLGTGTPNPVPERSGPAVAIVVGHRSYLVDAGTGIVRQAARAQRLGFPALDAPRLTTAFITHLHSDHTLGLADLILTPWVLERKDPLNLFGPSGLAAMTDHTLSAYDLDIQARRFGLEQANDTGIRVQVTEIREGLIYQDDLVKVEAFLVDHPPFEAYGYRFTTPDKTIVLSGDTCYNSNLIEWARGCDVLIHEVISAQGVRARDPKWKKYHLRVHTTSTDLGRIAEQVRPGKLVLYHQLFMPSPDASGRMVTEAEREEAILADIAAFWKGPVISARDLDLIE